MKKTASLAKVLPRTQFGDPILRKRAKRLMLKDIQSPTIQQLIQNMRHSLVTEELGVALAAPQVGESLALTVIAIRPSLHRPDVQEFDLVLINPDIVEYVGEKTLLWEGCISGGSHGKADLFAKVPRYKRVRVKFYDEHGTMHEETFEGLKAQIVQHETDHLNGMLFVDRVEDTKTFMTHHEYMTRIKKIKR